MTKIDTKPVMIPFQSKQALIDDQIRSIQANVSSSSYNLITEESFLKNLFFRRLQHRRSKLNLFISTVRCVIRIYIFFKFDVV